MEILDLVFLILLGSVAGFFNVMVAGGSLLTIPLLIFMGLPPVVANGTNRIAILIQNIVASGRYHQKKLIPFPFAFGPAIAAALGSILGAYIATHIDGQNFQRILAVIMILVAFTLFTNPSHKDLQPRINGKYKWLTIIAFFFVGIYGGFLHAGIGVFMLMILTGISRFSLKNANAIKIFVAMVYVACSIFIFIINDAINWKFGLILAIGNTIGGWIGTQVVINKGEQWIKVLLIIVVIAMSIKLWFF